MMLVVFTGRIRRIDKYTDEETIRSIAQLYSEVFSGPPWFEEWEEDIALAELEQILTKKGFSGVYYSGDRILGFSWGYKLPTGDAPRINFTKIRQELKSIGIDPDKTFYGADSGVKIEYRNKGIATMMIKERTKNLQDVESLIFRTKNPAMLAIYRKIFGMELGSFPEETAYKGGIIYVFRNK